MFLLVGSISALCALVIKGTHWGLYLHTRTIVREGSKSVSVVNSTHCGPVLSHKSENT